MTEFSVRAGSAKDLVDIVALERATAEAPHWAEAEYLGTVEVCKVSYVKRVLFIAEAEGTLIGFAVGKVVGDLAELESVAVDSRARRGGVGRALCKAVMDWSRTQGADMMELEVRAASGGAIELYRGLGFVPVGRRSAYYKEPLDDAVLMRLDLVQRTPASLPEAERL